MTTHVQSGGAGGVDEPMRPVIAKALVVCLAVAIAPWLSGGQEPLGMLLSGFALLLGALLAWRQPTARALRQGPLVWAFGLLIGLALLSLIWTANRYSSAVWIVQWVMAGLAFRLAFAAAGSGVGRVWLVRAYAISAGIFSVVAIWMYLTSEYGRLTGTFYWANPAAAYLIPAIVLGLDRMRRSQGREQYGWMALTVLWGAAFLLTDSRAATVVLMVVVALYLLLARLNRRFWILFVFTIVLASGVSFGLLKLSGLTVQHSAKVVPGSRFNEAIKGESTSGSDRLYFIGSAFDMWFTRPLGGVGAGAYGDVHPQYQKRVVSAATSAHNVYVQTLAELGLMGAALLGAVLLMLFLGSIRGLIANPELMPIALGTLGLLMHFGLDIDARYPALLLMVGAFFGLLYAQKPRKWVAPGWHWPVAAALVLAPIISLYQSETWAARANYDQTEAEYGLAAEHFGRATEGIVYNPDYVGARGINLYSLASQGGKDGTAKAKEALASARQAQSLDPHDAQHHQLEGRVLAFQGKPTEAATAFRRALELDSYNHPDYALDLAATLVRQEKPEEALRVAGAMLRQYPPEVVGNRASDEAVPVQLANLEALTGNIYLGQGKVREAGAAADRALMLDKQNLRGRALKRQVEMIFSSAKTPG